MSVVKMNVLYSHIYIMNKTYVENPMKSIKLKY